MTARATKPRHSHQIQKRARAGVKGLIISWIDVEPLRDGTDLANGRITHRNPVYRLTARTIFRDFGDWITTKAPFRWQINIKLYFDYPNGATQIEERELEAVSTISALNEHCLEQIEDALRHGGKEYYRHTEFTIECLGSQ